MRRGLSDRRRRVLKSKKSRRRFWRLALRLPKFGADGDYGSETRQAVREFQTKAGLSGAQVDGIVGPITLGLLDRASRQGSVTTDTDAAEQDLKVTGKATSKLEDHLNKDGTPKEPARVFFEFDSDKVASDEKDKLKALHDRFPAQALTLKGLASEEGSASYNLELADRRRESVKTVLRDEHKHDAALITDHPPKSPREISNTRRCAPLTWRLAPRLSRRRALSIQKRRRVRLARKKSRRK